MQPLGGDGAQADVKTLLLALQRRIHPDAGTNNLQSILLLYERLLNHRHTIQDLEAHLHSELLRVRGMMQSHPDLFEIVDTVDTLVDRCLDISHLDNDPLDMTSALRLLTALAGGVDGRTFVLEDPTCVAQELGGRKTKPPKRIGERIRMDSIGLLLQSKSLFHAECIPLGQQDVLAQHDFSAFGAFPDLKHRDLWVPEQASGNFFMPILNAKPWAQEAHTTSSNDSQPDLLARVMQKQNDRKHQPIEPFGSMFGQSLSHPSQPSAQADKKEVFFFDATKEFRCDSSGMDDEEDWRDDMSGHTLSSSGDLDHGDHDPWSKRYRQWEDMSENPRLTLPIKEITPELSSQNSLFTDIASMACNAESGVEVCECDVIEDILLALCGVESVLFRRDLEMVSFKLPERRKIKLENGTITSLASVLAVFERAGSRFMRLEYLAIYYSQNSKRGGKTLQAMGNALLLYLKAYQMHVQQIVSSAESSQGFATITMVLAKTRSLCAQMKQISQLFGCNHDAFWPILTKSNAFPRGLALLNHLHAHMQAFSAEDVAAHLSELIAWLLVKSSEPFLLAMSEFISRGRVSEETDPFNEFELTSWSRDLMEKAGATGGDNLFSSHLTEGSDSASRLLPNFLQETAERIIYMGQLQGLLLSIDFESTKYVAVDAHEPLHLYLELDKAVKQMDRRKCFMQRKRFEMDAERSRLDDASAAAALIYQQANVDHVKLLRRDEEKSALYERSLIDGKKKRQAEQRKFLDDQIADKSVLQEMEHEPADEGRRKEEQQLLEHDEHLEKAREELLTRYSEMMVESEERHQYMTWRRNRARRIATVKQQIQQLYTSEVVAWNREIQDPTRQISRDDRTVNSGTVSVERMEESFESQPTMNTQSVTEYLEPHLPATGKTRSPSNDISTHWRPTIKVNREAGGRSSVVLGWSSHSQESTALRHSDTHDIAGSFNGDAANQTIRVLREPGGGGRDAYACLYENSENETAMSERIRIQANDTICDENSASRVDHDTNNIDTGDVHLSNDSNCTFNGESTDVEMKEAVQDTAVEAMILAPTSPISVEATDKFESIFGFPMDTLGFFSPSVMEEDRELLSRVIAHVPRSVLDLTPFKMIVKRCLDMPIELAGTNLDHVALEVFREKLYILDHLHRLHKIMLMAEGLCLDMFARDLLAGLHSTTRVNWGFDGRLTSALSLAMVEAKVPENRASTHFSYRVSPDLADVLGDWNMAPVVSEVVSRMELSYDVQWPLGVVITSNSLNAYARIHRFLLYCRLTSLELNEIWMLLRTIDRRADLAANSRMQCHDMFTKTHGFLTAFNESFSADVLTVMWNELLAAMNKCKSIMELRAAHEKFVAVSEHCCFLDASAKEIYSAILHLYSVTWKFSSLVRKLEHRAIDNQIAQVILEKIWEDHNDALRILVSELQASPDRNQDARRFCEQLILRFDFNNYYSVVGS